MEWSDPDLPEWELPEYLYNAYGLWSLLGTALVEVSVAHKGLHDAVEDEGDTLLRALIDSELQIDWDDGTSSMATIHDLVAGAHDALKSATSGVLKYLEQADMLPPWWDEMMKGEEDDGA